MATPENILTTLLEPPPAEPEAKPAAEARPATEADPTQPAPAVTPESDEPETTGPIKLADLARQLELKPDELFAAVNSEGHSATDAFAALKEHRDIDAERVKLERSNNALRVEKAQADQTIADYVALLPAGQVDQALVDKLTAVRQQADEVRQAQLLAILPEWKDPSAKQADVEAMTAMIAQFGAMPADLGNIREAWVLNMTRHFTRLDARINAILAKADKPKPKGVKAAKTGKTDAPIGETLDIGAMVRGAKGAR